MRAQGQGPLGQRRRRIVIRKLGPARSPRPLQRRAQIIGQSRAQRRLEPRCNGQQIQHLPAGPRVALDQPGQRGQFGAQCSGFTLGPGHRGAGVSLSRLRLGAGHLGRGERLVGQRGHLGCPHLGRARRGQGRIRACQNLDCLRALRFSAGRFCHGLVAQAAGLVDQPLGRLVPGRQPGGLFRRARQAILGRQHRRGPLPCRLFGQRQAAGGPVTGFSQPGALLGQARHRRFGIAGQVTLARGIAFDLGQPFGQAADRPLGPARSSFRAVSCTSRRCSTAPAIASSSRRGGRAASACSRPRVASRAAVSARAAPVSGRAAPPPPRQRVIRLGPATIEKQPFGPPQRDPDLAIARRRPRRPGE